jgi:hypothetical protein
MRKVIGAFEKVSFPDLGIFDVIAKIDTGAASGSVHATGITEITLPTGEKAVRFQPYGRKNKITVNSFTTTDVKSSNGQVARRYVIPTIVEIEGVQYNINISLADRTLMKKGVLIGRKFLRSHGFLVDTSKGTEYRYEVKS